MTSMKYWNQLSKNKWTTVFLVGMMMFAVSITSCDCTDLNARNGAQAKAGFGKKYGEDEDEGDGPGVGITNIGNTCYMNATLQMLKAFYSSSFKDGTDLFSQAGQKMMEALDGEVCVSEGVARNFFQALQRVHNNIWPVDYAQEDAEELLTKIFEKLHFPQAGIQYYKKHPYTGELRARSNPQPFRTLQISFDNSHGNSMEDYLDALFAEELLPDDTKWNDSTAIPGIKGSLKLTNLSNLRRGILIVHAKRFMKDYDTDTTQKIHTAIQNPFQLTIKKEQIVQGKEDVDYYLAGFIVHHGQFGGGHYVSYAKKGGIWYLYDDSQVYTPTEDAVKQAAENAYIYFYKPVYPIS